MGNRRGFEVFNTLIIFLLLNMCIIIIMYDNCLCYIHCTDEFEMTKTVYAVVHSSVSCATGLIRGYSYNF